VTDRDRPDLAAVLTDPASVPVEDRPSVARGRATNQGGAVHGSGIRFNAGRQRWAVDFVDRFGRRRVIQRARTREEAEELRRRLTGEVSAWRLTGVELRVLRGPVVYILKRGTVVLYVGRSAQGLARPLASSHHVLGRLAFDGSEELTVFPCTSAAEAAAVEAELIVRMAPTLNKRVLPLARREGRR
jgi:hypothetical protein